MSKDMTLQQIDKAVGNYRAMLVKHTDSFPADAVQSVLGDRNFAAEQFRLFRARVEACSGIIIRDFTVDLNLVGMRAISATGCVKHVNEHVAETMPRATVSEGKLYFFQIGRATPADKVEAGYAKRGLIPVDPHTLCAFNAANQEFADTHHNGTQWKDENANICRMGFGRWSGMRRVYVGRNGYGWDDGWWFAGVSK